MGDGGADAGQEEQPGAENAGGGAVCYHLTFQTLLQPVRMAHPWNLLQPLRVGSAIFRMQVAEGCDITLYYKTGVTMYCTLESKGTVYCKVGGHHLIYSEKQRYTWNLKGNQG